MMNSEQKARNPEPFTRGPAEVKRNRCGGMVEIVAGVADLAPPKAPPVFYHPACGTLCNIFWWVRTNAKNETGAGKP